MKWIWGINSLFFCVIVCLNFEFETIGTIIPLGLCALVLYMYTLGRKNRSYKNLLFFSYSFYSLIGTINYCVYLHFCGFTFAPFHDDSYYWMNITALLNGDFSVHYTFFELVMAVLCMPFKSFHLEHCYLLPVNWMLGAIVVVEAVKFARKVIPIKTISNKYVNALIILLNTSFIDGTVHFYRDIWMCLFFIIALNAIYENKYVKSLWATFFTGLIRGANAFILLFYMLLNKMAGIRRISRSILLFMVVGVCLGLFALSYVVNIEDYMRSFSSQASTGASDSFSDRIDYFLHQEGASGGVVQLLRSPNPFLKLLALPIYIFSPFKVGDFFVVGNYTLRFAVYPSVLRFRTDSVWEIFMIVFYAFMIPKLFVGFYYWLKDKSNKNMVLFFTFIVMMVTVTYISMQTRHKMMFILLYPLAYNYYIAYSSDRTKQKCSIAGSLFLVLILCYNLI